MKKILIILFVLNIKTIAICRFETENNRFDGIVNYVVCKDIKAHSLVFRFKEKSFENEMYFTSNYVYYNNDPINVQWALDENEIQSAIFNPSSSGTGIFFRQIFHPENNGDIIEYKKSKYFFIKILDFRNVIYEYKIDMKGFKQSYEKFRKAKIKLFSNLDDDVFVDAIDENGYMCADIIEMTKEKWETCIKFSPDRIEDAKNQLNENDFKDVLIELFAYDKNVKVNVDNEITRIAENMNYVSELQVLNFREERALIKIWGDSSGLLIQNPSDSIIDYLLDEKPSALKFLPINDKPKRLKVIENNIFGAKYLADLSDVELMKVYEVHGLAGWIKIYQNRQINTEKLNALCKTLDSEKSKQCATIMLRY